METAKLNQNGDCIVDLSAEQLLSEDSSYSCGVFGEPEPEFLPRVGDEYQVEIPSLITGHEYDCYLKSLIDAEKKDHVPFDFWLGLSVPVTWINNINKVTEDRKDEKHFSSHSTDATNKSAPLIYESVGETINPYQGSCYFLVPGVCVDSWNDIEEASFLLGLYIFKKEFVKLKRFVGSKKMGDILLFYYVKFYRSVEYSRWRKYLKVRSRKRVYGERIFSGLRQQELLSRLLPQVSEECKKALTEVSVTFAEGDMSLVEYVSLLKAIVGLRTFIDAVAIGKGKQDLTGMANEPVRSNQASHIRSEIPIGKACSYLTRGEIVKFLTGGYRLSKARSNDLFWEAVWPRLLARGWHSEQPKNHAYVSGGKHSLVFLTPGVKKFSRRRLVKGNDYYDSVTDVLSKVGSEPELLRLDTEKYEGKKKEENGWIEEIKEEENLPEKRHCYLQPRTPSRDMDAMKFTVVDTSLANGKICKFRELRTLPKDMSNMKILSEDSDHGTSEVSTNESDCAHNMFVDQEETNSPTKVKILFDRGKILDGNFFDSSSSDQLIQMNGSDSIKPVKKARQNKLYDDKNTKPVKSQLSQKIKRNDLDSLALVTKRHRTVTACSNEKRNLLSTFPLVPMFGEDVHGCCSDSHDPNDKVLSQMGSSQDRLSFTSSPKGSSPQRPGGAQDDDCHGPEHPQSRILIDLNLPEQPVEFENGVFLTDSANMQNVITGKQHDDFRAPKAYADIGVPEHAANINLPQQPVDYENGVFMTDSTNMQNVITGKQHDDFCAPKAYADISVPEHAANINLPQQPVDYGNGVFMTDSTNMQNDITSKQQDDFHAPKSTADISGPEHPANINSRRQSTRNRPPTARALEALVNGYLTATRRRKKDSDAHETSRSRPPRRSRVEVEATGITTNDAVIAGESGTGMIDGNINMFDKLAILSNGNGSHISNP